MEFMLLYEPLFRNRTLVNWKKMCYKIVYIIYHVINIYICNNIYMESCGIKSILSRSQFLPWVATFDCLLG